ncbi:hypothetical protein ACO2Q7_06695 [Rathayibacter sp. KR2-224]
MTKTEITPRLCAGVAVLVPSAFTGPAGFRRAGYPAKERPGVIG